MRILPIEGKWYVCELALASSEPRLGNRRLAGPFDTEAEAYAAQGAIEAEHRQTQAEIWQCPATESDTVPA
jgi:hypothetical protein